MLRLQVAVLRRQVARRALQPSDWALLAGLSRLLGRRHRGEFFIQPETLLRWHRNLVSAENPIRTFDLDFSKSKESGRDPLLRLRKWHQQSPGGPTSCLHLGKPSTLRREQVPEPWYASEHLFTAVHELDP